MKIQNIFRMQVAVMAIGAALLLAGAARAQEIDNPSFDEGSSSVPFTQPSPSQASAALQNVAASSPATVAASVATDPAPKNNVVLSGMASSEGRMIAAIALCLALVTGLRRSVTRRRSSSLGNPL